MCQHRCCRVTMHFIICLLLLFVCQYIYSVASTYGILACTAYIRYLQGFQLYSTVRYMYELFDQDNC